MNIMKENKWLKSGYSAGATVYFIGVIINLINNITHITELPQESILEFLVNILLSPVLVLVALALVKRKNIIMFILGNAYIIYKFSSEITFFINNMFNLGVSLPHLLITIGGTVMFCCAIASFIVLIKTIIKKL